MTIKEGRKMVQGMRTLNESAPAGLETDVLAGV